MKLFTQEMSLKTQNTLTKSLAIFILSFFMLMGSTSLQAQMVTVTPAEFTEGMKNPFMGLRENVGKASDRYPYNTVVRCYVYYNELDNASTDGLQKILDYTNTKFKDFEKWNIKVIVRVILQYTSSQYYWPADLKSSQGDYTSSVLRARVLKTVENMGKAWDNDPRIAWVEMGLIGQWGEQESPMGIDESGVKPDGKSWLQILAPAFKAAFINKKVEARHMSKWEGTGFVGGMYWDTYGSYSSMTNPNYDYNSEIIKYNNPPYDRYKVCPMGGEMAYGLGVMRPELSGTDENDTYKDANHRRWIKNVIAQCRTSVLGIEYSNTDQSAAALTGLKDLQKGLGYRFLINEFQCTQQTQAGGNLTINAKIVNAGVAPFYYKWPLAFVLINESTKQIVYKSVLPNVDITKWYPGEKYDWKTASTLPGTGTEKFLIPAVINNISATVAIPSNIANGTYYAGLAILDPTTNLPGVFFSVNNFFKVSNSHPLCQIGIGVAPNNTAMNNVTFDGYNFATDSRYYSLTPAAIVKATGVSITPATLDVSKGLIGQITANVQPTDATNKSIIWSSSDINIATVNSNGQVTGVALGNAVITAKTVDGGFTATSSVTVKTNAGTCILPWTATDFSVDMNNSSYSSGPIDISCATSVKIQMDLSEVAAFTNAEKLTVSYKIDGTTMPIVEKINDFVSHTVDLAGISGKSLEILISCVVANATQIYDVKNLSVTSTTASASDLKNSANNYQIYPNPVSNILNIEFTSADKNRKVNVYNSVGQLVSTIETDINHVQIDVVELKLKGIVMIQIVDGNSVSNHKVIVK